MKFLKLISPYLLALAAVGIAMLIRTELSGVMGEKAPLVFFTPALIISAWAGGLPAGLLALGLSMIWGFRNYSSDGGLDTVDWIIMGSFTLNGLFINLVCETYRRSRGRAEEAYRKVAEGQQQIQENEQRQRAILDAIPHLIWTSDAQGNLVYVNQRWSKQLDAPLGKAKGRDWTSFVHTDDLAKVQKVWANAKEQGVPLVVEFRLKVPDGTTHWHLGHLDPSKDASGKISGWFGTATDVNDFRKAVDAVRTSEERFRRMADSAPVLIWISDTVSGCTWFNRPWLDFTGRKLEDEIGTGWTKFVHPDDIGETLDAYRVAYEERKAFEVDYRIKRQDGVYRWLLDRAIPLFDHDGTFTGYIGGCIDITERKEAEENSGALLKIEQAARAEAERTALLKDEFLATVSHEMRTPLTAMLGWVQLLRNGSLPSETVPQALETIERNARAQAKLIDDLLDMSRILSGRLRLDVQKVNLIDIVEGAIAAAEPAAAAKKIRINSQLDVEFPFVSGDSSRLQQVTWNLLNNAIKFTPAAGEVNVKVERAGSQLEITVADTGEGIDPQFLPHVFERFRQQDASTSRKHQGLGLGLAIVKQLVELHGGSVRATSPGIGQGSSFIVRLPLAAAFINDRPAEKVAARSDRLPDSQLLPSLLGTKILVVDDDDDARELLRSILAQSGASVRTAASAAEAMEQFDSRPPNILISDIGMPHEDGYELIKQVRAREREAGSIRIPALALTAFARSDDRRKAINAGFHMHLAKPVEPSELVTVVASLVKR